MAIILDGSTGISSIGTLTGVTSISSAAANTPVVMQDSGSNTNTCRAWVNFNGTGTPAIVASFNVTSITDNGTGRYQIVFTNAMPDANYAVTGCAGNTSASSGTYFGSSDGTANTTLAASISLNNSAAAATDRDRIFAAVFR